MDLTEIQHAIEELPKDQLDGLAAWIAERDQAEWDRGVEAAMRTALETYMDLTEYRKGDLERRRTDDLMQIFPRGRTSILDIGARDGYFSQMLAERFAPVTALDLQQPTFDYPGVTPVAGDVTDLHFQDGAFDVVFCAEVLEHIPPQALRKACAEISRVARHEAVIGVPYRQDLRVGRTTCQYCGAKNPPWGHLNSFEEHRLAELFHSMRAINKTFVGRGVGGTNWLSAWLMDLGGNSWGTYNQEEPCIACGRRLVRPEGRSLSARGVTAMALLLRKLQFARAGPMWIHMVFSKDQK